MTTQQLAEQYQGYFEKRTREDGSEFWCTRDDRPAELHDLIHEAHGDMLPDDWRYAFIYAALCDIAEADDPDEAGDDIEPDPYTFDRLKWLASHLDRPGYCDAAIEEFGLEVKDTVELVGYGQYQEKREVFGIILSCLLYTSDAAD